MAFKVGDKVRCVDASGLENQLTANRVYTVSSVHSLHYDNKGIKIDDITTIFVASRFVLADEPKPILVPVDPNVTIPYPDPIEAVRYGFPKRGETALTPSGGMFVAEQDYDDKMFLIVRKRWQASISIPPGWWVYPVSNNAWFASDQEPYQLGEFWNRSQGSTAINLTSLNFSPPPDGQPRQVQ